MNGVNRIWFKEPSDLKNAIARICDYLAKEEKKVYIVNRKIEGKYEYGNFHKELSIEDLRNLNKIEGVIKIEDGEYSLSLTNSSCSYFKKKVNND